MESERSAAQDRCEHALPQVGVLRELGPCRCTEGSGHAGEHLFDFPEIKAELWSKDLLAIPSRPFGLWRSLWAVLRGVRLYG